MDVRRAMQLLETERERLLEVRRGLEGERPHEPEAESAAELSALDQHQADIASEMFEREKDLSILVPVGVELREVAEALARVERGTYGTCEACGTAVSDERLEAVPATRYCVEHEARWELEQITHHPEAGAFAEDIAGREGARHLEFLPGEEGDEDLQLSAEESALHVLDPAAPTAADQ